MSALCIPKVETATHASTRKIVESNIYTYIYVHAILKTKKNKKKTKKNKIFRFDQYM